jgi:hypothetical protein
MNEAPVRIRFENVSVVFPPDRRRGRCRCVDDV